MTTFKLLLLWGLWGNGYLQLTYHLVFAYSELIVVLMQRSVLCALGLQLKDDSDVTNGALISLLLTLGLFPILHWCFRCSFLVSNSPRCQGFTFVSLTV